MYISELEYYIPNEELSIEQFVANLHDRHIPIEFNSRDKYLTHLRQSVGLTSLRVETQLEAHEMIDLVIQRAVDEDKIKPFDIDLLVFIPGGYPTKYLNIGQYFKHKHNLENALILNIGGNECLNIEMAIKVCMDLMKVNQDYKNTLIITAAKVEGIDHRINGKFSLRGDSAGLLLLNHESPKVYLHDVVAMYNSKLFKANPEDGHILEHYIYLRRCLSKLIQRNSLKEKEISKVITQNIHSDLLKKSLNSFGLNENLIFGKNIYRYGHMNQLDFLINLKDLVEDKREKDTQWIISIGLGLAGNYIATLMSY